MATVDQNIEFYAGDDIEILVALKESNGTTALNLTGAVINWSLSSIYDTKNPLIAKSSSVPGEIVVTNISGGLVSIFLIPIDSGNLGGQPYYHEMEIVSGGTTVTVMTGTATIRKTLIH